MRLRRFFLLGLAVLLPSNTLANSIKQLVRFYPAERLPSEVSPRNTDWALKATKSISASDGRCTGFFISNDGNFLTALHCVRQYLINSGAADSQAANQRGYKNFVIRPEALSSLTIPIELDGHHISAPVLASGPGFMSKDLAGSLYQDVRLGNKLRGQGYDAMGDFIIVKMPVTGPTACIQAAGKDPDYAEPLWLAGYPAASERGDGFDSNGKDLFVSFGKATTARQNECIATKFYGNAPDELKRAADWYYNNPGTAWTNLDALQGSSGGPVLDSSGQAVGLMTNIEYSVKNVYHQFCGAANYTRLSAIRRMIDEKTKNRPGQIRSDQLFNCSHGTNPAAAAPRLPEVLLNASVRWE